jgi:hypothetical protein
MHETILCASTNERLGVASSTHHTLLCGYKTESYQAYINWTSALRGSSGCALLAPAGDFIVVSFGCAFYPVFSLFFFFSLFHCTCVTLANKCHCESPMAHYKVCVCGFFFQGRVLIPCDSRWISGNPKYSGGRFGPTHLSLHSLILSCYCLTTLL